MSKLGVCIGVAAVSLAMLVAGCGDSGSSDSGETVTTSGANERLTSAQWEDYQASAAELQKANVTATATLKKCSATSGFQNTTELQNCVGDDFSELATATDATYTTVEGFQDTVSGSCATALDALLNYLGTFRASAAQMQTTIDSSTLAGYPAATQDLELALTSGKSQAQTFEEECAPA